MRASKDKRGDKGNLLIFLHKGEQSAGECAKSPYRARRGHLAREDKRGSFMAKAAPSRHAGANFLLRSLPDSEYAHIAPMLDHVHVEPEQVLYREGEEIDSESGPTNTM